MPRVAVVGAGPAGVYAAEALLREGSDVRVDVLDGLPTPYGLVRYGVAPDHPRTQSIAEALDGVLARPGVRFLGNVQIGVDVSAEELVTHYDAVVVAVGAAADRHLGIPGEELPGCVSATELVAWYNGHPDVPADRFRLDGVRTAVVVGAGNVAGDVARMLARTPQELRATDVPDHVLAAFADSTVREVHLLARRGPVQARFTTRELRELGELADADVVVDRAELELDGFSQEQLVSSPAARRNLEVLQGWAARPPRGLARRVHLHFRAAPVAVLGDAAVTGIRWERTVLDAEGTAHGAGGVSEVDAELVVRAVGYRSLPLPGLPFDAARGVVPNDAGRVVGEGGPVPGWYVAGWAKRGPTGVIGTNKHDARETVRTLLADLAERPGAAHSDPGGLDRLLASRGVQVVDRAGWLAIDAAERAAGAAQGRDRAKVADRAELLRLATGAAHGTGALHHETARPDAS